MAMSSSNVNILYIAGASRSGSTLLARLLNQIPAFWHVGELHHLWKRAIGRDEPCECGVPFSECTFWQAVLPRVVGELGEGDLERYRAMKRRAQRPWQVTGVMRGLARMGRWRREGGAYAELMERLCTEACAEACAEVGARVAVDSSKAPVHIASQLELGSVASHVLHLVRDPRAVAWSMQRRRDRPDGQGGTREMPRAEFESAARLWGRENVAAAELADATDNYRLVRYEDLVADPVATLTPILEMFGVGADGLSFISGATARMDRAGHAIAGNPMKFDSGELSIRLDDAWRREMPEEAREVVERIASGAMVQLGY
jgi:hypothetical protein